MSARRYRPRRRLPSDILPLVSVGVLACAVVWIFPRDFRLFGWRARPAAGAAATAGCAFVTLSAEQEEAALAAARTSWQSEHARTRRARIELLPAALPEIPFAPAVAAPARPTAAAAFRARPQARLLPPTEAAPDPAVLVQAKAEGARPAFSRETMLHLE